MPGRGLCVCVWVDDGWRDIGSLFGDGSLRMARDGDEAQPQALGDKQEVSSRMRAFGRSFPSDAGNGRWGDGLLPSWTRCDAGLSL